MPNVDEATLTKYIIDFHKTLKDTAMQFLTKNQQEKLLHSALLPAKITGFISTQFGVAIEYTPAPETTISIVRGSMRIENLFLKHPFSTNKSPPSYWISGTNLSFTNLSLVAQNPFMLRNELCNVTLREVDFQFKYWTRSCEYAEIYGDRTKKFWSSENAISKAKDEVLAALFESKRSSEHAISLGEYIATVKKKTVLILGAYDDAGMSRLKLISDAVAKLGYSPAFIKDIPDIAQQDISQKVNTIGGLARFVIVDDSSMSGHLAEIPLCKLNNWVTILLRKDGKVGSWMTAGSSIQSNVIFELSYSENGCLDAVKSAALWAEEKIKELEIKFTNTYPWRP